MDITDIETEFVHFGHIRTALERMGVVGNLTLMFKGDPDAPRGYQFKGRGWRMFRRAEADAYIAKKREALGLAPIKEVGK